MTNLTKDLIKNIAAAFQEFAEENYPEYAVRVSTHDELNDGYVEFSVELVDETLKAELDKATRSTLRAYRRGDAVGEAAEEVAAKPAAKAKPKPAAKPKPTAKPAAKPAAKSQAKKPTAAEKANWVKVADELNEYLDDKQQVTWEELHEAYTSGKMAKVDKKIKSILEEQDIADAEENELNLLEFVVYLLEIKVTGALKAAAAAITEVLEADDEDEDDDESEEDDEDEDEDESDDEWEDDEDDEEEIKVTRRRK